MHREALQVAKLPTWMQLNNVVVNGVKIATGDQGSGVFVARELSENLQVLMTVPPELVLSLENVWVYAKSDRHLLQVLEAVETFSRVLFPRVEMPLKGHDDTCLLIRFRQLVAPS